MYFISACPDGRTEYGVTGERVSPRSMHWRGAFIDNTRHGTKHAILVPKLRLSTSLPVCPLSLFSNTSEIAQRAKQSKRLQHSIRHDVTIFSRAPETYYRDLLNRSYGKYPKSTECYYPKLEWWRYSIHIAAFPSTQDATDPSSVSVIPDRRTED